MFPESFLFNLLLFVAGQAAAWFYLRTGRLWIGGIGTAMLWIAADWAVMAKYVFAEAGSDSGGTSGGHFYGALVVMQIVAVTLVVMLAIARWRRRWSATAKERPELFAAGTAAYLHGEEDVARTTFRRLVSSDPWDAPAWIALGNVLRRQGEPQLAKRCYTRGLRVDVAKEYTDLANRLLARPALAGNAARRPQDVTKVIVGGGDKPTKPTKPTEAAVTAKPAEPSKPSKPAGPPEATKAAKAKKAKKSTKASKPAVEPASEPAVVAPKKPKLPRPTPKRRTAQS